MIVLGLMMNLANRVRRESADRLTRQVLAQLTTLMDEYQKSNDDELPPVQLLLQPGQPLSETALKVSAEQNSADFVRYLHLHTVAKAPDPGDDALAESLARTDKGSDVLEDPWGSPIVFMPQQNPAIGMAPGDAFFFLSAGPDRRYLSREDNVYSYEGSSER